MGPNGILLVDLRQLAVDLVSPTGIGIAVTHFEASMISTGRIVVLENFFRVLVVNGSVSI